MLPERLAVQCQAILERAGLHDASAHLVADSLVDAEARGIASHGVARTRIYSERLRAGLLDAQARPRVLRRTTGSAHVDAANAIGQVGAQAAIDIAIQDAPRDMVSVVGVAGSNHCGTLAFFTRQLAGAGLVGIGMSTAPPTMTYHGGRSRAVGTNPLSIAVPRRHEPPIVIDMATSATARGKIILLEKLGRAVPPGWAVDAEGRPTTDAAAALAGSVLPFAGPKGSGIAMMIDLLAGTLVSGVSGPDIGDMYEDWTRPQGVSHMFIAIDPAGWVGRDAFADHVETFAARVSSLPTAADVDRVLLPGEIEQRAWEAAYRDGISLPHEIVDDLDALAADVGVPTRLR
ncbi:Ldh family oxidoreductase [Microbacterium sp. ET2]|nr:Ldh family oxidoreductase [Microbacterium sp. ET2 (Ac-2212)]WJL97284.1 Ldh family oxidoreductase [Microbacterium sp. ET2 (Ac-2212)]